MFGALHPSPDWRASAKSGAQDLGRIVFMGPGLLRCARIREWVVCTLNTNRFGLTGNET
jgi:hypothetical protein